MDLGVDEPAPDCLEIVATVASEDYPVCERIPDECEGFAVRVVVTSVPWKKE